MWQHCSRANILNNSIQDELFWQLNRTVQILEQLNVDYAIQYGTLIGALRDQNINFNEVDNDISVNKHKFILTSDVRRLFHNSGLHIFNYGIYRVCRFNQYLNGSKNPPFDRKSKKYFPYTDLYPFELNPFTDWGSGYKCRGKWSVQKVNVRNIKVNAPNSNLANQILNKRYGDWHTPKYDDRPAEKWKKLESQTWSKRKRQSRKRKMTY